ncbi:PRP38 family protein, putative [Babesia ovis]|uniref:Pre-mRNA-splicing factor 38 n=1 Tax=Babesia ovis TaxID=5869 RepID=A0A9W5T9X7_BABOV|nr:PRP38 family protein, putative [Babesia ovis]
MYSSKEGLGPGEQHSTNGLANYDATINVNSNHIHPYNVSQQGNPAESGYYAYGYGIPVMTGLPAVSGAGESFVPPTAVQMDTYLQSPADTVTSTYNGHGTVATEDKFQNVQRCHMHNKPDLNCKFCRKYKSAVHELSRLSNQMNSQEKLEKPNQLPMTNSSTYNMNTLLLNNILNSDYYKSLATMNSHMDIINELAKYADHAEPYCSTASRAPSTLFCCLHKLFTLRLTEKQMESLIDCTKSPYARCCGFLYLRFVLPSDQLWDWFEPYLLDDETFVVSVNPSRKTTIGEFCERLLVEDKYFNTVLPRLPARFKNKHGPHLCTMSDHRRRRLRNLEKIDEFVTGKDVTAFVRGEWVEGTIQSVAEDYPTVTLELNNGEKESVDIAYVSLSKHVKLNSKRHRDSGSHGSRGSSDDDDRHETYGKSRKANSSKDDLLREYKRRESERALAVGKEYAKRPSSFKASLSSKMDNKHDR